MRLTLHGASTLGVEGTDGALPLGTAQPTVRCRRLRVTDFTIYDRMGAGWAAAPHALCRVQGRKQAGEAS